MSEGTFACWVCGVSTPHTHTSAEINEARQRAETVEARDIPNSALPDSVEPVEAQREEESAQSAPESEDAHEYQSDNRSLENIGESPKPTQARARAEIVKEIAAKAAAGIPLTAICGMDDYPALSTLLGWCAEDAELQQLYITGLRMRAAALAEQVIDHCEELESDRSITQARVQALKVVIGAKQWTMSRMLPKLYGEKVEHEHTGEVKLDEQAIDARLAHLIERLTNRV